MFRSLLLVSSLVLLVWGQTPIGGCGAGKITWYTAIDGGECSFGPITGNKYIAALSTTFYGAGSKCGSCYRVTGPLGSVIVTITDECPAPTNQQWCSGTHDHFDLSTFAFNVIANDNVPITYQRVACPVTGSVQYQIKEGSNKFWFGLLVRNHRMQFTKVEIKPSTSTTWITLSREIYNYWICNGCVSGGITAPISVRLTSETGEVLTDNNVLTQTTAWPGNTDTPTTTLYTGTVQFADPTPSSTVCNASSTSQTQNTATQTATATRTATQTATATQTRTATQTGTQTRSSTQTQSQTQSQTQTGQTQSQTENTQPITEPAVQENAAAVSSSSGGGSATVGIAVGVVVAVLVLVGIAVLAVILLKRKGLMPALKSPFGSPIPVAIHANSTANLNSTPQQSQYPLTVSQPTYTPQTSYPSYSPQNSTAQLVPQRPVRPGTHV